MKDNGSALYAERLAGLRPTGGDILVFGTSHPCLTFDKWKSLLLVDDQYRVIEELETLL